MPYVNNHTVNIHYQVEGQGPDLVLLHGFTSTLESWRWTGYVERLHDDCRLILVDARGHGNSDKPHDSEAYSPALMTSDIVAVLDDLNIGHASFWGYSMGGGIGFQLQRYHPTRFSSYIIGGESPYPASPDSPYVQNDRKRQLTYLRIGIENGPDAVVKWREQQSGANQSEQRKQEMLNNDYRALHARWVYRGSQWPDAADLLTSITVPCFLYAGDQDFVHDDMKQAATVIPHARFVSLPGLDHGAACFSPHGRDSIMPHVKQFLSQIQ